MDALIKASVRPTALKQKALWRKASGRWVSSNGSKSGAALLSPSSSSHVKMFGKCNNYTVPRVLLWLWNSAFMSEQQCHKLKRPRSPWERLCSAPAAALKTLEIAEQGPRRIPQSSCNWICCRCSSDRGISGNCAVMWCFWDFLH